MSASPSPRMTRSATRHQGEAAAAVPVRDNPTDKGAHANPALDTDTDSDQTDDESPASHSRQQGDNDNGHGSHQQLAVAAVHRPVQEQSLSAKIVNCLHNAWNRFEGIPVLKFTSVLVGLISVLWLINSQFTTSSPTPTSLNPTSVQMKSDAQAYFINLTRLLFTSQFPSQDLDTQLSLLSQGEAMLDPSTPPRQPSAITILVPPSLPSSFAHCFASAIGTLLNQAFDYYGPIRVMDYDTFNSAPNVTTIHDDLKAYLRNGGKVVILHDVLRLSREEQLNVLHAFCDNSQAFDKRATFFFIVPVPGDIYNIGRADADYEWRFENGGRISHRVFDDAWRYVLSADKRPAIIARITPTVLLLRPGDQCND